MGVLSKFLKIKKTELKNCQQMQGTKKLAHFTNMYFHRVPL